MIDYNGRKFSPAGHEAGDGEATVASYRQHGDLLWADFSGGRVRRGALTGLCRPDDTLEFSYTQGAPFWAISLLDILRRKGLATVSAARPSIYHPLTPMLQAAAAAFDFGRAAFGGRPSQMVAVLGSAPSTKARQA